MSSLNHMPSLSLSRCLVVSSLNPAVCSPLWGVVADRVGRKYLLVFGLAAFAIASVALGLSKTLLQAVLARCICKYNDSLVDESPS